MPWCRLVPGTILSNRNSKRDVVLLGYQFSSILPFTKSAVVFGTCAEYRELVHKGNSLGPDENPRTVKEKKNDKKKDNLRVAVFREHDLLHVVAHFIIS